MTTTTKTPSALTLEPYQAQLRQWPIQGRHILAQFDADSVVVYQAYRPSIGRFAAAHGAFGGGYSFARMSWVKPNFLWMMFRSGWGQKPGQEITLAIWLRRAYFDELLARAVASTFGSSDASSEEAWKDALRDSDVRLQWDPDHGPGGEPLPRRAIQLGVRGAMQRRQRVGGDAILKIEDVSALVAEQRGRPRDELLTPREEPYPVADAQVAAKLRLSPWPPPEGRAQPTVPGPAHREG
ncbi:MAG: DUF4291 family protein [Kofleriaceae bacterium]